MNLLTEWLTSRITQFAKVQWSYVADYRKKVRELEKDIDKLRQEAERVKDKVKEEEDVYGREVYNDVTEWLEGVDKIISEQQTFKKEDDRARDGCPPLRVYVDPVIRYCHGKAADEINKKVKEKLDTARYDNISRRRGLASTGLALPSVDYQDFESRIEAMDKIKAALRNSNARTIGVHGPTGVGKTTLVIKAAEVALEEKLFNAVIVANVTKSPDIRKIQGQIADMLDMVLEEESEHGRAGRIQYRLKKEKNTLIILDDLCAKLDLNMLGIPSEIHKGGDVGKENLVLNEGKSSAPGALLETKQPPGPNATKAKRTSGASSSSSKLNAEDHYRGCKVLLISEMKQVLNRMDVEASLIVPVEVLNDKEAETLFKNVAGRGDKNSEFDKLAAEIARKCHGLPMSIVTTARALKNQSYSVWKSTSQDLESQKQTGTPYYSIKLSYDHLESEELKITFLLCAQMGHDALFMDLVKYCIGLGFLQGIHTVKEARDRVQGLLVKLKQSALLSDSYSSDRVTMQNLVRSAALSIASKRSDVLALAKEKLDEWPDEDKLKGYTVISLRHCDIIQKFPDSINCPTLRAFQLENNDPRLEIPHNFFQQMTELRVLILTGMVLSPLPSSIRCLTKLRMLCLEQCMLGKQLDIIGGLKNLRILSFSGSDIESLPVELKDLSNLQIFDISNCSKLRVIPRNVISSLTSLEELYMRNTSVQWRKVQENHSENVSLSELGHLDQLTNLDIQIPSVAHLPENLFFDNLYNYKIVIGSSSRYLERGFKMPEKYELLRFLAIQQKDDFDIHCQKGIKMLFERVEILLLENLNGVDDIFYELNLKGFPYLQHLSIVSNSDIESLINPKDRKYPEKAFPKLESLHLYKLEKMVEICPSSCQLLEPSFGILKIIKIELCGQLKNVFLFSVAKFLTALETIQVSKCNSMEAVVHVETQNAKFEFSKLRSLTLQSLPEFVGLTSPISAVPETRILFHDKVRVSKLERMELSSIQVDKLCVDDCSHFENLIHLDVNGCSNLEYLLSFSMTKNLVKLQSLFVSECEKMEHLFFQGQDNDANMKIFPNLKIIKLSSMKSLSEIWSSKVPTGSFGKLDTLIIEKCDKFVNVFPHYMVGIFRSLGSLKVINCRSMKAIFDLVVPKQGNMQDVHLETHPELEHVLKDVHLETLPKLEHVLIWEKNQEEIRDLKNLQKIWVQDCDRLENIFPVSVALTLKNLECLVIRDCFGLREIVAKGSKVTENSISFEFPRLTTIQFSKLPKFQSFYPKAYELKFGKLNDLSVELCDKLEPFREETSDAQGKPLFPEQVINKLKSMQIESRHAKSSTNYYYRRDNLEKLRLSRLKNTDILYSFLHHNPNLKSLWLNDCSFEELVPRERPPKIESLGVVPKLKSFKLTNLPRLENIGFERDVVLQRIESLILKNCGLKTIAPSSVSLTHLTNLEVVDCEGLKYLVSPSTAKSLVQLRSMKVINCGSLEEIVSAQEKDDEEESAGKVGHIIVFRQLKTLELVSLKSLKSFCSSKSCAFEFPSLEKVVVSACPKMNVFSQQVRSTPFLQKLYVVYENKKRRWCWEGSLHTTIQYMFRYKKFFEGMDELSVSEHLDLEQVWQGKGDLREDWFYSLKTLKLVNCKFESYAIPSNALHCLESLKNLQVQSCDNITGIFEMDATHARPQDEQGIASFHNLQQVTVSYCDKLKAVFPAPLATKLKKLERLDVRRCKELLEIVATEEEAATGGARKFAFPRLTSLELDTLPQLAHFYSQSFTLECPKLNTLHVSDCDKLKLFQSQGSTSSVIGQHLFSGIEGISKVEELKLDGKDTRVLCSWLEDPSSADLGYLNDLYLYFENDDVNGYSTLPFKVLDEKAPNLETMVISKCRSLKQMFPSQDGTLLANLRGLTLEELFELHSIGGGSESLSKLEQLCVYGCPRLTTPLAQSFSNLRELYIQKCRGLHCLFTSSAANTLTHLEMMSVEDCVSVREIVGNESDIREVKFERLERIRLSCLPRLEWFYSGNATLQLLSLVQLDIVKCPKMKFFSENVKTCRGIQVSYDPDDDLVIHRDLNTAVVEQLPHERNLVLDDNAELMEGIWLRRIALRDDTSSWKLRRLTVEGCQFLSNAALPSYLLPFLSNLEELVVRKCDSVEAIFDLEDPPTYDDSNMIVIPLKILTLEKLPSLRHVWNEDLRGSLISFPDLEDVSVKECKIIKSLLPASLAKDKLEKLDVRNCEELVEIVAKDEEATKETNGEVVVFPRVTSLALWDLPNLRCICSGMHNILDWPELQDLDVYHCQMLKVFEPDGQHHSTIDKHGFVSAEKVSHLEGLSLNKRDVIMIEQGLLHLDLETIKFLRLQSFNDESDAFPHVFFSNVPLPRIEKFGVIDCVFKEIFPSTRPGIDYTIILSQLKGLMLKSMHNLNSIDLEQAWMTPLLENLEDLNVCECNCLTNLARSTVSFSHLTTLRVEDCARLEYLFTSSTAKSLVVLDKMFITNCASLETVVTHEEGDKPDGDVIFRELSSLSLNMLPKLGSFYMGNSTLNFPYLEDVSITQCRSIRTFSHGNVVAPYVYEVKVDGICCELYDLNTAIHQQFGQGSSPDLA